MQNHVKAFLPGSAKMSTGMNLRKKKHGKFVFSLLLCGAIVLIDMHPGHIVSGTKYLPRRLQTRKITGVHYVNEGDGVVTNNIFKVRGGQSFSSSGPDHHSDEKMNQSYSKRTSFRGGVTKTKDLGNFNGLPGNPSVLKDDKNFKGRSNDVDEPIPTNFIAETNLPNEIGAFRLRAYRVDTTVKGLRINKFIGREPCVIYSSKHPPFGKSEVPVRVHDQCFTSEVFGSQRCDCKEQLRMSLQYIHQNGGAVIYLQQEGRGIGLANKVAAYALQDKGFDTVDANTHLGFPEDCRQYGVVPSILKDMGITSIRLMTNNPRKVDQLESLGVSIEECIPMVVEKSNPFNREYLQTKQNRMNHRNFGEMLSFCDTGDASLVVDNTKKNLINDDTT